MRLSVKGVLKSLDHFTRQMVVTALLSAQFVVEKNTPCGRAIKSFIKAYTPGSVIRKIQNVLFVGLMKDLNSHLERVLSTSVSWGTTTPSVYLATANMTHAQRGTKDGTNIRYYRASFAVKIFDHKKHRIVTAQNHAV